MSQTFEVGQRVQYRAGGNWKPFGVVIEIQGGISLNEATLVSPMYKVRWDDGDESGWLSAHNLTSAEQSVHPTCYTCGGENGKHELDCWVAHNMLADNASGYTLC